MTSAEAEWAEVLDRFEASLAGYGDRLVALDHGAAEPVVAPFEPPEGLGPLPRSLAPRARRLMRSATSLETQLAADLDAVVAELRTRGDVGRRHFPPGSEPAMLDRTA